MAWAGWQARRCQENLNRSSGKLNIHRAQTRGNLLVWPTVYHHHSQERQEISEIFVLFSFGIFAHTPYLFICLSVVIFLQTEYFLSVLLVIQYYHYICATLHASRLSILQFAPELIPYLHMIFRILPSISIYSFVTICLYSSISFAAALFLYLGHCWIFDKTAGSLLKCFPINPMGKMYNFCCTMWY